MTRQMALPLLLTLASTALSSQNQSGGNQSQQRVAELKQSMAESKAKLQKYQWIETTQISVKGETRKTEQQACHYGPDGEVVKTPIGSPPAPPKAPPRGLKGKIVEKKVDELKDYMDRLKALIGHYAPPDPAKMKASAQAGKEDTNTSSGGTTSLSFSDYYKAGDKVTFGFDSAAKKLTSYDVDTYLDDPKKDIVTLKNQFASLPDGTNYLQQTVLDSQSKQIQITTTNSEYTPVSQ
jgi:hypothetical protein